MSTPSLAVSRAEIVTAAYRKDCGWGSNEEVLGDLLADLMHYVDALQIDREIGVDFDTLLETARMHHNAEKEGNE